MLINLIFLIDPGNQIQEEIGIRHNSTGVEVSERTGVNIPFSHMSSMRYSNILMKRRIRQFLFPAGF